MAKDPAFLFYSSDFLTGTLLMTMEQKGKYITLLCLQHAKGKLSEKDMLQICGTYDEDIFDKFNFEDGFYMNTRLKNEIEKRKAYSESRSNNRKTNKKDMKNISKTYVQHMENENINENINIIKDKNYQNFELSEIQIGKAVEYLTITKRIKATPELVKQLFDIFKHKEYDEKNQPKDERDLYRHFMNSLKFENIDTLKTSPQAIRSDSKAKNILGI